MIENEIVDDQFIIIKLNAFIEKSLNNVEKLIECVFYSPKKLRRCCLMISVKLPKK